MRRFQGPRSQQLQPRPAALAFQTLRRGAAAVSQRRAERTREGRLCARGDAAERSLGKIIHEWFGISRRIEISWGDEFGERIGCECESVLFKLVRFESDLFFFKD